MIKWLSSELRQFENAIPASFLSNILEFLMSLYVWSE